MFELTLSQGNLASPCGRQLYRGTPVAKHCLISLTLNRYLIHLIALKKLVNLLCDEMDPSVIQGVHKVLIQFQNFFMKPIPYIS